MLQCLGGFQAGPVKGRGGQIPWLAAVKIGEAEAGQGGASLWVDDPGRDGGWLKWAECLLPGGAKRRGPGEDRARGSLLRTALQVPADPAFRRTASLCVRLWKAAIG